MKKMDINKDKIFKFEKRICKIFMNIALEWLKSIKKN